MPKLTSSGTVLLRDFNCSIRCPLRAVESWITSSIRLVSFLARHNNQHRTKGVDEGPTWKEPSHSCTDQEAFAKVRKAQTQDRILPCQVRHLLLISLMQNKTGEYDLTFVVQDSRNGCLG